MKNKTPLFGIFLLAITLIFGAVVIAHLTGCSNLGGVGVQGGYDPNTQAISGGVTITFKQPPSEATATLLKSGGARAVDLLTFTIPQVSRDPAQRLAIQEALREGAVITRAP